MKKIVATLILVFAFANLHAQLRTSFNLDISADTLKLRHYKYKKDSNPDLKTLIIRVKFNDETIIDPSKLAVLNDGLTKVVSVDYVYTQYSDKKSQDNLNKKRLFELYLTSPDIFRQNMTCWRFIEQLGFLKTNEASKLFHGFVIRYHKVKPYRAASPAVIKEDILTKMKSSKPNEVAKILNRNPTFSKDLIVADYTCSMAPHYIATMAWFCMQQSKQEASFAFFNDGDGKPNSEKVIGKTGGIHQFRTNNLDTISNYVFETIKTGCSGDAPENDIEAILKAIEKNPNAKSVVLIADGWSDMRDIRLKYLIKKPVHIIVCGSGFGINPQYLDLAKITKGSIHTMEEDLEELFKMKEGQRFVLQGQEYVIRRGKILKLPKS